MCPIEAKLNGRKKCCCLRGLESNVIVVIVAPIIKRKKCHGRLVVGNTDDPRVVHRFMMCNCRAVRNNLWSFSPSFLLFPFFVSSSGLCPIFSFRSKFCLVNLKAKKSWRNVCFFVCLSETLFDMDRKENVGVVVLEPKYGKGRKRMRGGSKKINGKQRYRTTSDRSDCSATADTGKMYSAGEWCLPIFLR